MHPRLSEQVNQCLGHQYDEDESIRRFIESVDESYEDFYREMSVTAESMEQLSGELIKKNVELEEKLDERARMETMLLDSNRHLTEINEKLNMAQGQLLQADKMASIGQLAAGVAHEINNPIGYVYSNINSLQGYVNNLLDVISAYESAVEKAGNEEIKQMVDQAREEADLEYLKTDMVDLIKESNEGIIRVKKIVQDLKDFSHVDETEWQWADIHRGLDSTVNIVWNDLKSKVELVREYGDIPDIWCIASQINQVFMNLLINAGHAIAERGKITIATGKTEDEKTIWIKITDTGGGIPPENIKRIFDAFFTTKPVGKGTGLGLSLSYSIMKKHGGSINVESDMGKGTCFTLTLPIVDPETVDNNESQG